LPLEQPTRGPRRFVIAGVLFVASTLAAFYLSLLTWWLVPAYRGPNFPKIAMTYVTAYWLWVAATPLVVWVGRRFPLHSPGRLRNWGVHLLALHLIVGAVLLVHGLIQFAGLQLTPRPLGQTIQRAVALAAPEFLLIYLVLLLSTFAIDYFRKYRDREIRTAQLEASLQQAKLAALQAQLNPHFLFNALNAVSALMYRDVEAADAMLARIGELLRLTLAADGSHEIRLSEELELLERYLDIERIRFADRLAITVDVPDATRDAHVPPFALQPLVENAIRHGIAKRSGGGQVLVSARQVADRLQLRVVDDGPGLAGKVREGIGLRNTRDRLQQLYGGAQQLTFRRPDSGGLEVLVELPWRT
jgi:two-component system LytT family sensor kinase